MWLPHLTKFTRNFLLEFERSLEVTSCVQARSNVKNIQHSHTWKWMFSEQSQSVSEWPRTGVGSFVVSIFRMTLLAISKSLSITLPSHLGNLILLNVSKKRSGLENVSPKSNLIHYLNFPKGFYHGADLQNMYCSAHNIWVFNSRRCHHNNLT